MEITPSRTVSRLGFWSALFAALFSVSYVVAQVAEWLGLLGSAGGPESTSTPLGLVVLLTPSLFLGTAFAILMVSVHYYAPDDRKIWSHLGVVFATIYAVLISINYYVQLTFVLPRLLDGTAESVRLQPFLFVPFDSFLYSVDLLGYSFMSLATLFAAFVFTGPGIERAVRLFLIANGLVLPFLALQIYYPPLIWIASVWAVTFPGATIALAVLFRRAARATPEATVTPVTG
ncbi:hypothetical protein [Salinigranum marinum]|uniref:hypothetical protein n=1 Tax=Salinigranum marinum TaxID=1515595 RepID=UPI002989AC03|nr:hypothetical protein [Salinigranum marinum]